MRKALGQLTSRVLTSIRNRLPSPPKRTTNLDFTSAVKQAIKSVGTTLTRQLSRDRRSIVEECRNMFDDDPRVERALTKIATDATQGGVKVNVTSGVEYKRAQEVINATLKRIKLDVLWDDWTLGARRDGDSIIQLDVDTDTMQIVGAFRHDSLMIHRNSDWSDKFIDHEKAFWLGNAFYDMDGMLKPSGDGTWLPEFLVVHARNRHEQGLRYGRPTFMSARKVYDSLARADDGLTWQRIFAGMRKLVHYLPGATNEQIEAYKQANAVPLNDPIAPYLDWFSNQPAGSVQMLSGDGNLGVIDDIMYAVRTLVLAGDVPLGLLGYGEGLNRDILEDQLRQYKILVDALTQWALNEIVEPICERAWLLAGILPQDLEYTIERGVVTKITPQDVKSVAEAMIAIKATELLVDDEMLIELLAKMLPGIDVARALKALEKHNQSNDILRIDQAIDFIPPSNDEEDE